MDVGGYLREAITNSVSYSYSMHIYENSTWTWIRIAQTHRMHFCSLHYQINVHVYIVALCETLYRKTEG